MQLSDIIELLAAFGVGSGITKLIDWLTSRKSRRVNGAIKLGEGWQTLVSEIQEERKRLQGEVAELDERLDKAKERITTLEAQLLALQRENERLKEDVKLLTEQVELARRQCQCCPVLSAGVRNDDGEVAGE